MKSSASELGLITRLLKDYPQADDGRPWRNGRRRKAKLFERGTVSYVDSPTVIHAWGLCLGINLSTNV